MAEASWLRRLKPISLLSFFTALFLSLTVAALSSNTLTIKSTNATKSNRDAALPATLRIAIVYGDKSELANIRLSKLATRAFHASEVMHSPTILRGYNIAVITHRGAATLAKNPSVIATLLRGKTTLLVDGPAPVATLLANMQPKPKAPLTLLPLGLDDKPGLPTGASAAAIIPRAIYPDGKVAPRYIIFHNNFSIDNIESYLLMISNSMKHAGEQGVHIQPYYGYDWGRRWYYIGDIEDTQYITINDIATGRVKHSIVFHYTPDYMNPDQPNNGLWRIWAHGEECTALTCLPKPNLVVDSFIPRYSPLTGWELEPNLVAVNVSYVIDQDINAEWPAMDIIGPASESISATGSGGRGTITYTLLIPDSIVVKIGLQSEYSSYYGRIRDSCRFWLWGFQSLIGEARSGQVDTLAYPTAPYTAVDTRWPLLPPGLFVGVRFRDLAKASVIDPKSGFVVPGVVAKHDVTYRFYVSTVSVNHN